ALQQEGLAFRRLAQARHQIARLAGEDQGRMGLELRQDAVQRRLVRIIRHLTGGLVLPTLRGPALGHANTPQSKQGGGYRRSGASLPDARQAGVNGPRSGKMHSILRTYAGESDGPLL